MESGQIPPQNELAAARAETRFHSLDEYPRGGLAQSGLAHLGPGVSPQVLSTDSSIRYLGGWLPVKGEDAKSPQLSVSPLRFRVTASLKLKEV
jgi:hypothetical protein